MTDRFITPMELSKNPPNIGSMRRDSTQFKELNLLKKDLDRLPILQETTSTSTVPISPSRRNLSQKSLNNHQIRTLKKLVRDMFSRIATLYAMNYHLYMEQEKNKQEILKQKRLVKKKDESVTTLTREIRSAQDRESTLRNELETQRKELLSQLRSVQDLGERAKSAYHSEREALLIRINHLEREGKRISGSVKKLQGTLTQQTELLRTKDQVIKKLEQQRLQQHSSSSKRYDDYQKCILEIHLKNEELVRVISDTEKKHDKELAMITLDYENQLEEREAAIGKLTREVEGKARQLDELTEQLDEKVEESQDLKHQIGHQDNEIETLNSRIRKYFGRIDELDDLVEKKDQKSVKKQYSPKDQHEKDVIGKEFEECENEEDDDVKVVEELHQKLSSSFGLDSKKKENLMEEEEVDEDEESDEYGYLSSDFSSCEGEEDTMILRKPILDKTEDDQEYAEKDMTPKQKENGSNMICLQKELEEKEEILNKSFEELERTKTSLLEKQDKVTELKIMNRELENMFEREVNKSKSFSEETVKKIDLYKEKFTEREKEIETLRSELQKKEQEIRKMKNEGKTSEDPFGVACEEQDEEEDEGVSLEMILQEKIVEEAETKENEKCEEEEDVIDGKD